MNESPTATDKFAEFGQRRLAELTRVKAPLASTSFISPTPAADPKLLMDTVPLMVMKVCGDAPRLTVDADANVAVPPPTLGRQFELATSSVPTRAQLTPSKNLKIGKFTLVV